jgi:acyl carrier protein
MEGITERIEQFISTEFLEGEKIGVGSDASLLETGIIDSIGLFRLVAFLEESFAISVQPEDLLAENFESIDAISGYIRSQLATRG